jgi:hypothetical protein
MQNKKSSSSSSLNSSSRAKRSTTNLSNLRLAPLSQRYADATPRKGSFDKTSDDPFSRSHSSYLQGKSAPTTPGILSRNSSRRQLHGLSRRSSIYDNPSDEHASYEYAGVVRESTGGTSVEISSGRVPKAKSEAALLIQRNRMVQQGIDSRKQSRHHSRRGTGNGGSTTPRATPRVKGAEDDWVTRTGATANAILQESKGQSWLSTRPSATSFAQMQDSTDDDDEGYEEMAALSTSTTRLADDELTPVNTRTGGWGSRYGSRSGSRRTSRRGSLTAGSRTPLAPLKTLNGSEEFFEEYSPSPVEPDFVDSEEELDSQDEAAMARITEGNSFGLGGMVDRLMNFNLFKVEEKEETTDDEGGIIGPETEEQATLRRAAEAKRKKEAKENLAARRANAEAGRAEQGEGGWSDAAWLLSVASKVIF